MSRSCGMRIMYNQCANIPSRSIFNASYLEDVNIVKLCRIFIYALLILSNMTNTSDNILWMHNAKGSRRLINTQIIRILFNPVNLFCGMKLTSSKGYFR